MTMKLCLSDIYVELHELLKGSYSEIENLQDFASWIVMVTDTTKIYFFVPDRNVLWCDLALDLPGMQTVFLETIVFDDIMEINFTYINTCLV